MCTKQKTSWREEWHGNNYLTTVAKIYHIEQKTKQKQKQKKETKQNKENSTEKKKFGGFFYPKYCTYN